MIKSFLNRVKIYTDTQRSKKMFSGYLFCDCLETVLSHAYGKLNSYLLMLKGDKVLVDQLLRARCDVLVI